MRLRYLAASLALTVAVGAVNAQAPKKLLEVTGLVGYTAGDVDKWSGSTKVNDWDQMAWGVSARLFFKKTSVATLGVEYGYQHQMWYELRIPYLTSSFLYPDYTVAAHHINLILRSTLSPKLFLDLGAGMHFFDGFVDPGLVLGLTGLLHDGPKYSFPIGIRIDPILDSDAMLTPITANLGLGIKLP